MIYTYLISGNLFEYFVSKREGWGMSISNPFSTLLFFFSGFHPFYNFIGVYILAVIGILIVSRRIMPLEYILFGFSIIIFSLINGPNASYSITRFSSVIFALPIAFAILKSKKIIDISGMLFAFQLVLMTLWVNGVLVM